MEQNVFTAITKYLAGTFKFNTRSELCFLISKYSYFLNNSARIFSGRTRRGSDSSGV